MKDENQDPSEPMRKVPMWMREYAANRTLGVALSLGIFVVLYLVMLGSSFLVAWAWVTHNTALLILAALLLLAGLVGTVWFSIPAWGGQALQEWVRAIGGDGAVAPPSERKASSRWLRIGILVAYLSGLVVIAWLVGSEAVPARMMQPLTALIVVPFLLIVSSLRRGRVTFSFSYIWAGLYALHALLIMLGVPLSFPHPWDFLDVLLPLVGYGFLAAFVGHIYSLVMLRRVKDAAQAALPPEEDGGPPSPAAMEEER